MTNHNKSAMLPMHYVTCATLGYVACRFPFYLLQRNALMNGRKRWLQCVGWSCSSVVLLSIASPVIESAPLSYLILDAMKVRDLAKLSEFSVRAWLKWSALYAMLRLIQKRSRHMRLCETPETASSWLQHKNHSHLLCEQNPASVRYDFDRLRTQVPIQTFACCVLQAKLQLLSPCFILLLIQHIYIGSVISAMKATRVLSFSSSIHVSPS